MGRIYEKINSSSDQLQGWLGGCGWGVGGLGCSDFAKKWREPCINTWWDNYSKSK